MNFSNLENNYVRSLRKNRNSVYSDFYDKKAIVYCHQAHFPLEGEGLFNIVDKDFKGTLFDISHKNRDGHITVKIIMPVPSNPMHIFSVSGHIEDFTILYDRTKETNYLFKMVISKKMKNVLCSDVLYYIHLFLKNDFTVIDLLPYN
tara:strand:+ start:5212 stop:5652 length:441 start_codon:yes stop_codon:yes gene_type:complete